MEKSVILITGCDAAFYPFMDEALSSLDALNIAHRAEIGILDLGLTDEQVQALEKRGCILCKPSWTMDVPDELKEQKQLGLVARTALRDYFPGFRIYVWFDADAWAQTPEFFDKLVDGVSAHGAAVIRENGTGYHRSLPYHRWWFGHMVATYGPLVGMQQAFKPAMNIGIMALSDTAPHWNKWIEHYQKFIQKRKKINLDQHAFNAALELEYLPYAVIPARCNWISTLSTPMWDDEKKLLCEPTAAGVPISVIHMAGPNKRRAYQLKQTSGATLVTPLDYTSISLLRNQGHANREAKLA